MKDQPSKDKGSAHKDKCNTMDSIMKYLYQPIDPSSLGMTRFLYGEIQAIKLFN